MKLYAPKEIDPLLNMALQDFSYSRMDSYLSCQKKYEFQYIRQLPQPWSPHLALGSTIHSVLEECVGNKAYDFPTLMASFINHRLEHDPNLQLPNDMLEKASNMLRDFSQLHEGFPPKVLGIEKGFHIVVGGARLTGYIDRIDEAAPDLIRIVDYKSGQSEIAKDKIKDSLQLGIYALAGKSMWPDRDIEAGMYYLRSGRVKFHRFTDEDLENVYKRVVKNTFNIIHSENFKVTYNVRICQWCPWAKTKDCTFGYKRLKSKGLLK